MSRITARSRAVLTLLFLFAVTTPHQRCLVANMALDPLASVGGMLTILGVLARGADCTDVHLARLIAGHRKPVSMFTTYLLPVEVQMSPIMKCLRETRIAVGRANVQLVFVQSRGRYLPAIAFAATRWSSSMATNLFWRSPIVELSPSLTAASNSSGRPMCWQGNHGQLCEWGRESLREFMCLLRSDWSLRCLDVCICTDASQKKGFAFAVREECRPRKLVVSASGRGSSGAPGPSVPGRVRSVPSRQMSAWSVQARTRM